MHLNEPLMVMKFGGSSVGTPERFAKIAPICRKMASQQRLLVVVSALSQVTRQLDSAAEAMAEGADIEPLVADLRDRHEKHARAVLEEKSLALYLDVMETHLDRLARFLEAIRQNGQSPALRDGVLAVGEQLSVPLVVHTLRDAGLPAVSGEATKLLVTDENFGEAEVRIDLSRERVQRWFASLDAEEIPVVAGFIGATQGGQTTTLGFEGSDYTAALLAAFLRADELIRWTDVPGIYTDDPNTTEHAQLLDRIGLGEASELNEKGQLGMHPKTLRPVVEQGVVMHVRCIDAPERPGTTILPRKKHASSS